MAHLIGWMWHLRCEQHISALAQTNTINTHLEVKELAVAPVNGFCTAITPGHFDDVNLAKKKDEYISAL